MNWAVVAPGWTEKSAGVEVMHHLIDRLNKAGENAFTFAPDRKIGLTYGQPIQPDVIVVPDVVPEIPQEQFPDAVRVRYCLYYPGGHGTGPKVYNEPVQITFDEKFLPGKPVMRINTVDTKIFQCVNIRPRFPMCAIYLGKGDPEAYRLMCKNNPTYFRITRAEPADQHNLSIMLNLSEYLYTFDSDTRLIEEAELCGCKAMVQDGHGGWIRSDYKPLPDTPVQVMIDAVLSYKAN